MKKNREHMRPLLIACGEINIMSKKQIDMIPCPCGTGHLIPKRTIINSCPHLYVKIMGQVGNSSRKTKPERNEYQERLDEIKRKEQEEMDKVVGYWVRTGDPSLINDLNRQREVDNFYRNRWD